MSVYRSAEADAFGAELKKFVDRLVDVYQNGTDYARTCIDSITANAYRVDDEQPTYDLMNYIIGLTAALPDDFGPLIEVWPTMPTTTTSPSSSRASGSKRTATPSRSA